MCYQQPWYLERLIIPVRQPGKRRKNYTHVLLTVCGGYEIYLQQHDDALFGRCPKLCQVQIARLHASSMYACMHDASQLRG
jgi:hypothetical protein